MIRRTLTLLLFTGLLLTCSTPQATAPATTTPAATPATSPTMMPETAARTYGVPTFSFLDEKQNAFVASEVARLSLAQKAGQMTQLAMDMFFEGDLYVLTKPYKWSEQKLQERFDALHVGSVLNHPSSTYPTPEQWHELMMKLQSRALKNDGVPLLYGIDAIHGPNYLAGSTLYAQPLGVAASFNEALTEKLAAITAYELKAASIPWNFSPAMDVGRNPVWSRTWESFGEDIYLNKMMGAAMVRGYQGDGVDGKYNVAACLKHFTGYGFNTTGRDRNPSYIPERQLREYYLPQYQHAIDQGAITLMINSGEVNGVPLHASEYMLTDVLRGELGFEGLAVSDWEDVVFLKTRHRVAPTLKEAARIAIMAGMDMSMTPVTTDFPRHVQELVNEGKIPQGRIDEAVARIIAVKVKLGLYAQNTWDPADFPKYGGPEHAALAKQSSEEAIVLLKNTGGALPLAKNKRVLVTGPAAEGMRPLNGGWTYSWQGNQADEYLGDYNTIQEAVTKEFAGAEYHAGMDFDGPKDMDEALAAAQRADVIIACMGENSYTEIEGNIEEFRLPQAQYDYYAKLVATGKPVILVMASGRPRIITEMNDKAAAVIYAPYPGPQGGDAIANILSGDVNPSGRLPLTYPRNPNAFVLYDHKGTEEVRKGYDPLYEFGHGLSYTDFTYGNLTLSSGSLTTGGTVTASVTVTNEGTRAGKHSVLLFSRDEFATVTPNNRRLRAFTKVELAPGASQTVSFQIKPEDLAFIGLDNEWVTEPGAFTLMVGDKKTTLNYVAKK